MRYHYQIARDAFICLALGFVASLILAGCNYPTGNLTTATASMISTSLPSASASPSEMLRPSATLIPSATPSPSETPAPSKTPGSTATAMLEQVGAVILDGREIGTIQRSGRKFKYTADPDALTPEVKGKVVLKIKDPQEMWGFNLESSSSPMYRLKDDPRSGWEAYGVLVAYRGSYEITVKFIMLNVQTGERLKGKVSIEIVGATVLATDTPEMGWYPVP